MQRILPVRLRRLLALLAQLGRVAGTGIEVQLANQRQEFAEAAAAREAGYFVGTGHDGYGLRLAVNDFHDGKENVVLHATQAPGRRLFGQK